MSIPPRANLDERSIVFDFLFYRTFNNCSHALRSAMSGNFEGASMYCRDLLETQFLIDYLQGDKNRPGEWLNSDVGDLNKKYRPASVRIQLDKRDGFQAKRRKQLFDFLSQVGSHPTPLALRFRISGNRELSGGPRESTMILCRCVEEIALLVMSLGPLFIKRSHELDCGASIAARLGRELQRMQLTYFSEKNPTAMSDS